MSVFHGYGDGNFSEEVVALEGTNLGDSMVAEDLTGDGVLDLILYSHFGSVTVAPGTASGTFVTQPAFMLSGLEGASPISVAVGDVTVDGIMDLLVQAEGQGVITFKGDGAGGYLRDTVAPYSTQADGFKDPIDSAFVDGDGVIDVIHLDSATGTIAALVYGVTAATQ